MAVRRSPRTTGTPGWVRLGKLLQERRERELDPRWYNRDAFAAESGVNLRLAQELELNRRQNITPVTLRDVIAPAYRVTFESLLAVRDEVPGSDLEAAPGSPPRRAQRPPQAAPAQPPDGGWLPPLGADAIARARPYADSVFMARSEGERPDAAQEMRREHRPPPPLILPVLPEHAATKAEYVEDISRRVTGARASQPGGPLPGTSVYSLPSERGLAATWDRIAVAIRYQGPEKDAELIDGMAYSLIIYPDLLAAGRDGRASGSSP